MATVAPTRPRDVSLSDRYELERGQVFLTGLQALVRVLLDQHRADVRAGLRTATLVSGYQGSPLGGLDQELGRIGKLREAHEIVLRCAVNEELGATAVSGSQLAPTLAGAHFDGVVGVWYGKAPGVDRAADAIRHANMVGTHPRGGVLALCGDDPGCKSSTIPSASERLLAALRVPVFFPGSIQETLDLGRHAIACSRASGLWSALKVVTNVADAAGTAEVGYDRVTPILPVLEWEGAPYVHQPSAQLLPPASLEMERTLVEARLELAKRYAQLNGLNPVVRDAPGAQLGIVAAGATAHDVLTALSYLGLEERGLIRVLAVGMPFPLDEEAVREFARGLAEIVVVEEKGPFLEPLIRDALYGRTSMPPVLGARDDQGARLLPAHGTLDQDVIARALGARVLARVDAPEVRERLQRLDAVERRPPVELGAARTPYFCSGCPHNSSLVAPDGALVGAGIGCHTMVVLAERDRGTVTGLTQMGGEGAQWIGIAPFVETPHFTQNLGDGTFHHSGSLAIRSAVAAGVNITYKLLYNGYVAMTGGQRITGGMDVPALVRSLEAEGVRRIVITTDEPSRYAGVELPRIAEVRDRREILAVQRELAHVAGVTVLLHDQACAAELRRERKRGTAPDRSERVVINERVCEGCGDCGEKSSCLSVEPVETEFGRKTRINQTSCNKDYSCLQGDCPSFITVVMPKDGAAGAAPPRPEIDLPEPTLRPADDVRIRMVGIGGTGVVTVSQVLGMAALLDGNSANGLDQTGLSQKAGPVVSDVHITSARLAPGQQRDADGGVMVPSESVDVLLGFDLLGLADPDALRVAEPERTVAIVSDHLTPTAQMIVDVDAAGPDRAGARAAIDRATRAGDNVYLDAQGICDRLFGDATTANVLVLGAAWQLGVLPVSLGALRQAIDLNGVSVERNLAALEWGRAWVTSPGHVDAAIGDQPAPPQLAGAARELVNGVAPEAGELRRLLEIRVPDLLGWGGGKAARSYVEQVARVRAIEDERIPGSRALTEAVACGLYKLTAYKDEYEVARLHLEGLAALPPGARAQIHLHPPLLRALGMREKLRLGRWFVPALALLRAGRRLRGTPLDLFGMTHVRRVERALPAEYLALVDQALARLTADTLPVALEIALLPDLVRGYEQIKLANVDRFRTRAVELVARLEPVAGEPASV